MLESLNQLLSHVNYKSALVEAGHFYADKPVGISEQLGIEVGKAVLEALGEVGLRVTPCLLIDDYNAPDVFSEANMATLKSLGFIPEITYREKGLCQKGQEMLALLTKEDKVKVRTKNGEKYLKKGWIKLSDESGRLTCALLDAALYQQKNEVSRGVCVTVLPDNASYRAQQDNTKQILQEAGYEIPILDVYFNEEGKVSVDFNF